MFCENCGSAVAENERFCGNCGAPLKAAASTPVQYPSSAPAPDHVSYPSAVPAPNPVSYPSSAPSHDPVSYPSAAPATYPTAYPTAAPAQQQGYMPQFYQQAPAPKPKKKALAIVIACIAFVLVAAIVTGAVLLFAPKSMAALEKESFSKAISAFNEFTNIESFLKDGSYSIELEPGDYLLDMISNDNVDLSWLEKVGVDFTVSTNDDERGYEAKLTINGTEITTLDAIADVDSKMLTFMLEGLSDSVGLYDLSDNNTSSASFGVLAAQIDMSKALKVLVKYYDIALDYLNGAEESNGTFEAGGVVQSCKIYTADLSERQLDEIAKKILESAIDDADVKDVVISLYDAGLLDQNNNYSSSSEYYEDFRDGLRDSLDDVNDRLTSDSDDTALTLVDYVSGNEIVGRKVITYSNGAKNTEFVFGNSHDGNKFGTVFSVNGTACLMGSGTMNGTKLNGKMTLYYSDSDEIGTIELVDYDYGKNEGEVDFSLSKNGWYALTGNSSTSRDLSLSTLKITFGDSENTFDFVIGNESLLKTTVTKGRSQKIKIDDSLPKVDYDDWPDTLDKDELIDRLEDAGVPDSLTKQIRSGIN